MKKLIVLLALFFCFYSNAQQWELSLAPAGLSNYDNWFKDRQVHVKAYQYSFSASGFARFTPELAVHTGKVHWYNGVGLSYSYHQAHWEYYKSNGVYQPTSNNQFKLAVGTISAELTPFILEFKNGLEVRSGLLVGAVVHADANFSLEKIRRLNVQLANRISYKLRCKNLELLPFYQFSTSVLREVTFGQIKPLLLQRHNVGISFKLGGQKEL